MVSSISNSQSTIFLKNICYHFQFVNRKKNCFRPIRFFFQQLNLRKITSKKFQFCFLSNHQNKIAWQHFCALFSSNLFNLLQTFSITSMSLRFSLKLSFSGFKMVTKALLESSGLLLAWQTIISDARDNNDLFRNEPASAIQWWKTRLKMKPTCCTVGAPTHIIYLYDPVEVEKS